MLWIQVLVLGPPATPLLKQNAVLQALILSSHVHAMLQVPCPWPYDQSKNGSFERCVPGSADLA